MKKLFFIFIISVTQLSLFGQNRQTQEWYNGQCGTLSFFNDSLLLHIEANTFEDQQQQIIDEKILISISLFKNYKDMMEGDIKMRDSKGIYVSGGMFDIQYHRHSIRKGKKIRISYVSDGIYQYNGYRYDSLKQEWKQLSTPILDYARNDNDAAWGNITPKNEDDFSEGWGGGSWGWDASLNKDEIEYIYKVMDIEGAGLHNYDFLINNSYLKEYELMVNNENIKKIYVHYRSLNTLLYYTVKDKKIDNFALLDVPSEDIKIFIVHKKGGDYVLKSTSDAIIDEVKEQKINTIAFMTMATDLNELYTK